MDNPPVTAQIAHYLNLVVRRRWLIMVPLWVSTLIGIYLLFTLPRIFRAETLILIEPQRVPTNYVRSLVSIDINARISTIKQQVLSRTNLEKIIQQYRLYAKPEQRDMFMEDKVEGLRRRIDVQVTRARQGADAFAISFKGAEPEKVMHVANALATFFIDENLKVREAQAIGTSSFLDDELEVMRERLVRVEQALNTYRQRYMGELPEQLDSNLRSLDRLQLQLGEKQESLRAAKTRYETLKSQISEMPAVSFDLPDLAEETFDETEPESSQKLTQLREQLKLLKTRYTDRHPDVVRIKSIIARLEAEEQNRAAIETDEPPPEDTVPDESTGSEIVLPEFDFKDMQKAQRNEIKKEIAFHEAEITKIKNQIGVHEQRVENTPKREQELLSIQRDYSNIQAQYNSLLNRKLEAEIAVNMERKQKGEQFRILDPARLPQKPIEPNTKMLLLFSIAAGLGFGGGVVFLLDFFDASFKSKGEIESLLGLPVLTMIPEIRQPGAVRRRRVNWILSLVSLAALMMVMAVFAFLALNGIDQGRVLVGKFI